MGIVDMSAAVVSHDDPRKTAIFMGDHHIEFGGMLGHFTGYKIVQCLTWVWVIPDADCFSESML